MPNYVSKIIDENSTELLIHDTETSAGLAQEIEDRTTAVDGLSEQVADAVEEVQQLSNDIIGFDERISVLEGRGKRYVILSDDYDDSDYSLPFPILGWTSRLQSNLGIPTADFKVIKANGAGVSTSLSNNWGTLVLAEETDATVTEVIVGGGINDANASSTDIANGFTRLHTALNTVYPNANVSVAFIAFSADTTGTQEKLAEVASYYQLQCSTLGYRYIQGSEGIMYDKINGSDISDKSLPDSVTGKGLIARQVASGFLAGSCNPISTTENITVTLDGQITSLQDSDTLNCKVANGYYNISAHNKYKMFISGGMSYECDPDSPVTVGTLTGGYINGNHSGKGAVLVACQVRDGTTWYDMQGKLLFKDGKMYIGLLSVTTTSFRTLSALNCIIIEPFTASLPVVLN